MLIHYHQVFSLDSSEIRSQLFNALGLSFRPQASFDLKDVRAFISISLGGSQRRQRAVDDRNEIYAKNLDEFLRVCK